MLSKEKRVVIRCSADNARQMRAFVRSWPALDSLVAGLHADGLIEGMRAVTVTLQGPGEWVDQGLAAELPQNGREAAL